MTTTYDSVRSQDLNQQNAQCSFLDITLCTHTCFNPQGIIIRKQVLNKIAWNLTGYCFIHN